MLGALCVSVGIIGLGLLMIFGRDFTWGLTEFSNQTRGVESERTEVWDSSQIIYGIVAIIAGVVLSLMILGQDQKRKQEINDSTATSVSRLAQVQQYGTPIATLQNVKADVSEQIAPGRLGIEASGVTYGRCSGGKFYAYIFDKLYHSKAVAYVPDSSPGYCHPDWIDVSQVTSLGNGWYELWTSDNSFLRTTVARTIATIAPDAFTPTPVSAARPTPEPTPEATP